MNVLEIIWSNIGVTDFLSNVTQKHLIKYWWPKELKKVLFRKNNIVAFPMVLERSL